MVFQKPTPFPMSIYDNIAFGVRLFETLPRAEMDDRVEWARKGALWNEVKDKLKQIGPVPAASSSACASRAASAIRPRCCCSTNRARPRSDLDRLYRELIGELKKPLHRPPVIVTTTCSGGGARCSDYTPPTWGRPDRVRADLGVFMKPKKKDTEVTSPAGSAEQPYADGSKAEP